MTSDSNDIMTATEIEAPQPSPEETFQDIIDDQDLEAQQYAINFLKYVIRRRGVRIERESFLTQELRKLKMSDTTLEVALAGTPLQAGVPLEKLDELAKASINFETNKSAAMSFSASLPGGFAMLATVPADMTQYYVHAFRVMQKITYLYGWHDLLGDLNDADDETVGKLALFLGVMMGVSGAASSLSVFASQVARPALRKHIAKQALTKTVWYPVVKKTLAIIGVKVTKDSLAKTVTKLVPVAGGVISGGMTLVALKGQSARLQKHLRELPPPGVDAAEYQAIRESLDVHHHEEAFSGAQAAISDAAEQAKDLARDLTGRAKESAALTASRAKKTVGGFLRRTTTGDAEES